MTPRKTTLFIIVAFAGLGALFLVATGPLKPLHIDGLSFTPLPCSEEPSIEGLHNAQSSQVRRLAAYQLLCQSAAIRTLVVTSKDTPPEFERFGIRALTIPNLTDPRPTEINGTLWLPAATSKDLSPTRRAQALQDIAARAELLVKQGKSVGIYIVADAERTYFNGSEAALRDFITRCSKDRLPLALYDRG